MSGNICWVRFLYQESDSRPPNTVKEIFAWMGFHESTVNFAGSIEKSLPGPDVTGAYDIFSSVTFVYEILLGDRWKILKTAQ